jgi:hypothetical protein
VRPSFWASWGGRSRRRAGKARPGRFSKSCEPDRRPRPPWSEAWLLGALGEIDDAFDVLARAEEEHQGILCYTGLPGFDSLRADPRFGALLERLELPRE